MTQDCPCHSGLRYNACCEPYHAGGVAPTPEALMRSRYAAFARGLGNYLVDTLASGHPDLDDPRPALLRALSETKNVQRFQKLLILHTAATATDGEVLFFAGIFGKGTTPAKRDDRSFAELSRFTREGGAWRYAEGRLVPAPRLPKDPSTLDRAAFLRLFDEVR